jgi:sodium transport system permease protein
LYHAPSGPVGEPPVEPVDDPVVEPARATAIVATAIASYLVAAIAAPRGLAVLAAQVALAVVPIAALVVARRPRPLAELGLGWARPRFFAAGAAIGATIWYVNLRLVALLPLGDHPLRALAELVARPPLLSALALFALVPAVCEELLFRGVLARALGSRFSPVAAAAISSVVFSAYHLSPAQALPTLSFGFALALIAIRAGSILPTMLAHAINNALALAMSRSALPQLADWIDHHPTLALLGCATATAAGIGLVAPRPRTCRRPDRGSA